MQTILSAGYDCFHFAKKKEKERKKTSHIKRLAALPQVTEPGSGPEEPSSRSYFHAALYQFQGSV